MNNKNKSKKILAIICEYNPMHTGHIYLINKAKEITKSDFCLGLMSGNFSERSEPCVLDKYSRAKIACENGLDLVLNLPTAYCTNNAEIFALSSVKILNQFKIDYLAFGVETLNEEAFYTLANFLNHEPKFFKNKIKKKLKDGINYNQAITQTIRENINLFNDNLQNDILNILSKPNNILALEYVKSLLRTKSKIKPIFIERVDNYNDEYNVIQNYVSSSFLRKNLQKNNTTIIQNYLAKNSLDLLKNSYINTPLFKSIILYNIKTKSKKELKQIYSVNEGLENKLKNEAEKINDFDVFYQTLTTKRYKQNKINSVLLNSVLDIDKNIIRKIYKTKKIYVKALAINNQNKEILSYLNTKYLITRKIDIKKINNNSYNCKLMKIENKANSLYNLIANTNLFEQDYYNKMR